jgi:hypothetical protein
MVDSGEHQHIVGWRIDRVVHFGPGDFLKAGFVHFGFHDRNGRRYGIAHQKHFLGAIGDDDSLLWTLAAAPIFSGVPNIEAGLCFPMYVDSLPDGTLVVSNFGNAHLYRVDVGAMRAVLLVDGSAIGMRDMGNCVVDAEGYIWVNEVEGCRVWRFDPTGRPVQAIGDGRPGFQLDPTSFPDARFNWIYDIRPGPDGNLYVLDSRNFALRMIDRTAGRVITLAGNGTAGYAGDGGEARAATFGGDPTARFDGPISLSLDEAGNIYVGDRYNHVVRKIERENGIISTIAGHAEVGQEDPTDPSETDPLRANLPQISSMDYHRGRLFVPTDLGPDSGDLVVLKKAEPIQAPNHA